MKASSPLEIVGLRPTLYINHHALEVARRIVAKATGEAQWFFEVERVLTKGGGLYYVLSKPKIPEQEVSMAYVESPSPMIVALYQELQAQDPEGVDLAIQHMTCWCHSHVNMGVSPSGTDNTQFAELLKTQKDELARVTALVQAGEAPETELQSVVLTQPWIMMIWNKADDYYARVFDPSLGLTFQNPEMVIASYDLKEIDAELDRKLKPRAGSVGQQWRFEGGWDSHRRWDGAPEGDPEKKGGGQLALAGPRRSRDQLALVDSRGRGGSPYEPQSYYTLLGEVSTSLTRAMEPYQGALTAALSASNSPTATSSTYTGVAAILKNALPAVVYELTALLLSAEASPNSLHPTKIITLLYNYPSSVSAIAAQNPDRLIVDYLEVNIALYATVMDAARAAWVLTKAVPTERLSALRRIGSICPTLLQHGFLMEGACPPASAPSWEVAPSAGADAPVAAGESHEPT
jgi:hypothetical protein